MAAVPAVSDNNGCRAGRFVSDLRLLRTWLLRLASRRLLSQAARPATAISDNDRRCVRFALKVASYGLLRYRSTQRQRGENAEPVHDPILRRRCHLSPNPETATERLGGHVTADAFLALLTHLPKPAGVSTAGITVRAPSPPLVFEGTS
jgi:hypothetical protein